jgi:MYXO-CTERM domain-containing protein
VFAGTPITGPISDLRDNITVPLGDAGVFVADPTITLAQADFYPRVGQCQEPAIDMSKFAANLDYDLDFNGVPREPFTFRGAYAGQGVNPGWQLAAGVKPVAFPGAGTCWSASGDAGFGSEGVNDGVIGDGGSVSADAGPSTPDGGPVLTDGGAVIGSPDAGSTKGTSRCGCHSAGPEPLAWMALLLIAPTRRRRMAHRGVRICNAVAGRRRIRAPALRNETADCDGTGDAQNCIISLRSEEPMHSIPIVCAIATVSAACIAPYSSNSPDSGINCALDSDAGGIAKGSVGGSGSVTGQLGFNASSAYEWYSHSAFDGGVATYFNIDLFGSAQPCGSTGASDAGVVQTYPTLSLQLIQTLGGTFPPGAYDIVGGGLFTANGATWTGEPDAGPQLWYASAGTITLGSVGVCSAGGSFALTMNQYPDGGSTTANGSFAAGYCPQ